MGHTIAATTPGVFYRRPSPDAAPYVEDGAPVVAGDVVGLIEVMKTYREVKADVAGTVTSFLVGNEDEVTIGQGLLEIDP